MPLQIVTIPCLSDNYAYLLHDAASGDTALIDAPQAEPILDELHSRGWRLGQVLLTHHHWDHVDALPRILEAHPGARVVGAAADAHRLPPLDTPVAEGDTVTVGREPGTVIDVSGHTVGTSPFISRTASWPSLPTASWRLAAGAWSKARPIRCGTACQS